MKVPLFYILSHLKMAIYTIYQLLRSVMASTMSDCHLRAGFPRLCITSFMKESMGARVNEYALSAPVNRGWQEVQFPVCASKG